MTTTLIQSRRGGREVSRRPWTCARPMNQFRDGKSEEREMAPYLRKRKIGRYSQHPPENDAATVPLSSRQASDPQTASFGHEVKRPKREGANEVEGRSQAAREKPAGEHERHNLSTNKGYKERCRRSLWGVRPQKKKKTTGARR